jgi:hypothetical protein
MEVCCLLLIIAGYLYHLATRKQLPKRRKLSPDGVCLHANTSTYDVPGSSGIFTQCDSIGIGFCLGSLQVAGGVLDFCRSPSISGANDVVARNLNVGQRENTRARSARRKSEESLYGPRPVTFSSVLHGSEGRQRGAGMRGPGACGPRQGADVLQITRQRYFALRAGNTINVFYEVRGVLELVSARSKTKLHFVHGRSRGALSDPERFQTPPCRLLAGYRQHR